MLILSRRPGETLYIGDEVKVTVVGVKGHQVRLGVTAPPNVSVHREEIYQRVKKEQMLKDNVLPYHEEQEDYDPYNSIDRY